MLKIAQSIECVFCQSRDTVAMEISVGYKIREMVYTYMDMQPYHLCLHSTETKIPVKNFEETVSDARCITRRL